MIVQHSGRLSSWRSRSCLCPCAPGTVSQKSFLRSSYLCERPRVSQGTQSFCSSHRQPHVRSRPAVTTSSLADADVAMYRYVGEAQLGNRFFAGCSIIAAVAPSLRLSDVLHGRAADQEYSRHKTAAAQQILCALHSDAEWSRLSQRTSHLWPRIYHEELRIGVGVFCFCKPRIVDCCGEAFGAVVDSLQRRAIQIISFIPCNGRSTVHLP